MLIAGSRKVRGARALALALVALLIAQLFSLSMARGAPMAQPFLYQDPNAPIPDRVADLLGRMTLDEKIGQMVQAERANATPSQAALYNIGSILSGGGSSPSPNTPSAWADMVDSYQQAALTTRLGIPLIYGVDAVHGHNNVYGATIFPHNIGLGATRNPALVQEIGRATALEVRGTGITWDFAPCLCVVRDERWGRSYESFSEDPTLVVSMTSIIDGYQGSSLLSDTAVLATAKHYIGDGGTNNGDDQGNTAVNTDTLRQIHLPPFQAAIDKGVGSVMISYSSWNNVKLHMHTYLISDVLKGELGFDGFVVSDWNAIHQLPGTYAQQVRASVNAGIDMFMEPQDYIQFISSLKSEHLAGRVSLARIDDAVRRILTKKFEQGLFERPFANRSYTSLVGAAEHRAIARQAVRESLVLLKNEEETLPLSKNLDKIFVAGKSANDIGNQSGGWTLSWQGGSGRTIPGTSILQGILGSVSSDTAVSYDREADGIDESYDAAIVVIGETPYAEGNGDIPGRSFNLDSEDQATLAKVQATGVPMVVVLVSGRPLNVTAQLPEWDAFIAAWLPGSEGQGVADVLFGDYAPTGKLPLSWPRSLAQLPINVGDASYDPLFPYGYGLAYPASSRAYQGKAASVPGRIELENFDEGGEGLAYHDIDSGNNGGRYRAEGVDIEQSADVGGGFNIGWTSTGEWLQYTIDVSESATYTLDLRVSNPDAGASVHVEIDGVNVTGALSVPQTGGWQSWQSVSRPGIWIEAGRHKLRLVLDTSSAAMGNYNYIQLTSESLERYYLPLAIRLE